MSVPRALFFLSDLGGGGAQKTLLNLAGAIPESKMEVELAVADSSGPARRWVPSHLPCHYLRERRMARSIPSLAGFIGSHKPDVVLSTMLHANIATWIAMRMARSEAALVLRETNSHRAQVQLGAMYRRLGGIAYRRADLVVALSEGVRRELVEDMALQDSRTVTISNPVEVEMIRRQVNKARKQPSPFLKEPGRPIILGIGRLVFQKGFDILIDAVARHVPEGRLVLLGEGPDRAALAEQASRRGMSERLLMPGFVEDISPYLAHSDIFALSSRWEGFGHVIVEAMAAGLAVVATDCPHGPADIFDHDNSGLLVPVDDSEALGQAIKRVAEDRALAERLARDGAAEAKRFESAAIAMRYIEAFTSAIRHSIGPAR